MHVVSASRRTDIPAFYLPWFMERCREGYADVRHPVLRGRSTRVDLRPSEVSAIVFWSRSYAVFQLHHHFFRDYELFFHFTINPPHPVFEPHAPRPDTALEQLRLLAETLGGERVVWRYDPLVTWERDGVRGQTFDPDFFRHVAARAAAAGVTRCVTSFADLYTKARRRVRESHPEICFWALAGGQPMKHYKKTDQGLSERRKLLKKTKPTTDEIINAAMNTYYRKDLATDDILDAIALTITAAAPSESLVTIPKTPEKDPKGLPMEIVYCGASDL